MQAGAAKSAAATCSASSTARRTPSDLFLHLRAKRQYTRFDLARFR
jgi:hypothetical protein